MTNYHVIDGRLYGEYTGSHRLLYMFDEAGTRYSAHRITKNRYCSCY